MTFEKMKKQVQLSTYSVIISLLSYGILIGLLLWQFKRTGDELYAWILFTIIVAWSFLVLFYTPMSIAVNDRELSINRSLKIKTIPLSEISDVRLSPPTLGERRICGSGGFFGYWGWFSQRDIGRYFAYYGKASDCFLVTLKDGRKYLLGCKDAPSMVAAIQSRLPEVAVNNGVRQI